MSYGQRGCKQRRDGRAVNYIKYRSSKIATDEVGIVWFLRKLSKQLYTLTSRNDKRRWCASRFWHRRKLTRSMVIFHASKCPWRFLGDDRCHFVRRFVSSVLVIRCRPGTGVITHMILHTVGLMGRRAQKLADERPWQLLKLYRRVIYREHDKRVSFQVLRQEHQGGKQFFAYYYIPLSRHQEHRPF